MSPPLVLIGMSKVLLGKLLAVLVAAAAAYFAYGLVRGRELGVEAAHHGEQRRDAGRAGLKGIGTRAKTARTGSSALNDRSVRYLLTPTLYFPTKNAAYGDVKLGVPRMRNVAWWIVGVVAIVVLWDALLMMQVAP